MIRELNADEFELPESHGAHDLSQVVSREELLLLCVEQVEADFQALYLIIGQAGQLVDLLEVNIAVGVRLACHAGVECLGCGQILLESLCGRAAIPFPDIRFIQEMYSSFPTLLLLLPKLALLDMIECGEREW